MLTFTKLQFCTLFEAISITMPKMILYILMGFIPEEFPSIEALAFLCHIGWGLPELLSVSVSLMFKRSCEKSIVAPGISVAYVVHKIMY